jgi:hypothetical protein
LFAVLPLTAADFPVVRLDDFNFGTGTPVYAFTDPVTQRRFLVVRTPDGVAMIEATPVPVVRVTPVEPVRPVVPQKLVPPNTRDMWEVSRTYVFTQEMAEKGWEITNTSTDAVGREVCHLRRKNPSFKLPDVEKPKE